MVGRIATIGAAAPAAAGSARYVDRIRAARAVIDAIVAQAAEWGVSPKLNPTLQELLAKPDLAAAGVLEALENPKLPELAAATAKNRAFAEGLAGGRFPGSSVFVHVTSADALPKILQSANVDVLFLGAESARQTQTTGVADMTRVAAGAGGAPKPQDVSRAAAAFGGVAIVYDPARLDASKLKEFRGTDYNDHWGYPIGLPNTAIGALQVLETRPPNAQQLKQVKQLLANKGLYVPIVSSGGKLLFTPSDFDKLRGAR